MHIRLPNMTVNERFQKFKIQYGHLENFWPIFTKFCKMAHISPLELTI